MKKKYGRNTLRYKIDMFIYNLTWDNFITFIYKVGIVIFEMITIAVMLLLIIFLPAFFH